jgi:WD40 repeat protein
MPATTALAPGSLALNSSGRPLLADTADLGSVRLWALGNVPATPPRATVYSAASPRATGAEIDALAGGVALSGNGTILAASEVDNGRPVVALYRTAKPGSAPVATIRNLSDGAVALALSSTGNLLAVSDNSDYEPADVRPSAVRLYDIQDLSRPRLVASLPGNTFQVMFSPDDHMLVAFTANMLLAWDISDPSRPAALPGQQLSPASDFSAGAFSPDGTLLAAEDGEGVLWLWHVAHDRLTGQSILQNQESGASSGAVAFSPDGRTLAVAGQLDGNISDPAINLWDVANPGGPRLEAQWAQPNRDAVDALGFSPAGQVLVAEGQYDINLWSTNPAQIVANLCAGVGDTITPAEWKEYIPGLPYRPPCDRGTAGGR